MAFECILAASTGTYPGVRYVCGNQKAVSAMAGAALSLLVGACGAEHEGRKQGGDDRYSVLATLDYSILREFDRAVDTQGSQIAYPVCVTTDFATSQSARTSYMQMEQATANRWNDALLGAPGWRVSGIQFYMVGGTSPGSCPNYHGGLRVYKAEVSASNNRAYAEYHNFKKVLGRSGYEGLDQNLDLHEFGHQLGLGDTYTEVGYQVPIGQPQGIMNSAWAVSDLTADDIAAVRHVWSMIYTGSSNPCSDDYQPGQVQENNLGSQFCVPLNEDPSPDDPLGCNDNHQHCAYWASVGYCAYDPFVMAECCGSCDDLEGPSQCVDNDPSCGYWASVGNCSNQYAQYMSANCCASCTGGGPSCTDAMAECGYWASYGYCSDPYYAQYMSDNCCASCGG